MKTEIIFMTPVNNQTVVQQIISERSGQLLTEDQVFPKESLNLSLKALGSTIEKVEIDEANGVRRIYVTSESNMILG